jgi:hypothetical protein
MIGFWYQYVKRSPSGMTAQVNYVDGNPVEIAAAIVWCSQDTAHAFFGRSNATP